MEDSEAAGPEHHTLSASHRQHRERSGSQSSSAHHLLRGYDLPFDITVEPPSERPASLSPTGSAQAFNDVRVVSKEKTPEGLPIPASIFMKRRPDWHSDSDERCNPGEWTQDGKESRLSSLSTFRARHNSESWNRAGSNEHGSDIEGGGSGVSINMTAVNERVRKEWEEGIGRPLRFSAADQLTPPSTTAPADARRGRERRRESAAPPFANVAGAPRQTAGRSFGGPIGAAREQLRGYGGPESAFGQPSGGPVVPQMYPQATYGYYGGLAVLQPPPTRHFGFGPSPPHFPAFPPPIHHQTPFYFEGSPYFPSPEPLRPPPTAAPTIVLPQRGYPFASELQRNSTKQRELSPRYTSRWRGSLREDVETLAGHWLIDPRELTVEKKIGEGRFGVVFLGRWRGIEVAIKRVTTKDMTDGVLASFKREVAMMTRLHFPNVVHMYGACLQRSEMAMVMEYMARGSLFDILRNKAPLSPRRRLDMAKDVAIGLSCLHLANPPILHHDLKSLNLLVDKDWKVKVCDFGMARVSYTFEEGRSERVGRKGGGTAHWMAPEVMAGRSYTRESDVYSYGCVLYELATRHPPFEGDNAVIIERKVLSNHERPDVTQLTERLAELKELMKREEERDEGFIAEDNNETNKKQSKLSDTAKDLKEEYIVLDCLFHIMKECWKNDPKRRPPITTILRQLESILPSDETDDPSFSLPREQTVIEEQGAEVHPPDTTEQEGSTETLTSPDRQKTVENVAGQGSTPSTAVPALEVDPKQGGHNKENLVDLYLAVECAQPGDVIEIGSGDYLLPTTLTIDKPNLTITGVGKREEVTIMCMGLIGIRITAKQVCISNITIDHEGKSVVDAEGQMLSAQLCFRSTEADYMHLGDSMGDNPSYGIEIDGASAVIDDCMLHSDGHAAVAAVNRSTATVRGCSFLDCGGAGVHYGGSSAGDVKQNAFAGCRFAAISISTLANPHVQYNKIVDGGDAGVFVFDEGRGQIVHNMITGNAKDAITMANGGYPRLRNNDCFGNRRVINERGDSTASSSFNSTLSPAGVHYASDMRGSANLDELAERLSLETQY